MVAADSLDSRLLFNITANRGKERKKKEDEVDVFKDIFVKVRRGALASFAVQPTAVSSWTIVRNALEAGPFSADEKTGKKVATHDSRLIRVCYVEVCNAWREKSFDHEFEQT